MVSKDREGRAIDYLRIAVTDRGNLPCRYGVPVERKLVAEDALLMDDELVALVRAAAACGLAHVRLTGGETGEVLMRKGLSGLIKRLKALEGIQTVTITTNGVLLPDLFADLKNAGIDGINIDLDTLDAARYQHLNGQDSLDAVKRGLRLCLFGGVPVKLNVTVMEGSDLDDLEQLAALAKTHTLDVRFVELLPLGHGKRAVPMDNYQLLKRLRAHYSGMKREVRQDAARGKQGHRHGMGPAVYYEVPDFAGSIGFISAIHDQFCDNCNRLRVSCTGKLQYCLCYEDGLELAPLLRARLSETKLNQSLREQFRMALRLKPKAHPFAKN